MNLSEGDCMGKPKGIIMIAVGAIVLFSGIRGHFAAPEIEDTLKDAVYIEDGRVLPENEGKLVVVSGKLESETPLVDSLTGMEFSYPCVTRRVDVYEKSVRDGEITWNWDAVDFDYSKEGGGINTPSLVSTTLVAPTKIGEFNIADSFIVTLSRPIYHEDYDEYADILAEKGWNLFGGGEDTVYLSKSERLPVKIKKPDTKANRDMYGDLEGITRISYQTVAPNNPLIYTFVGIQQGNDLVESNIDITTSYRDVKTLEEIASSNKSSSIRALIFTAAIGILLLFFGIKSLVASLKG